MVIVFFFELFLLFLISRTLTSNLSFFFYNIFKSTRATVILIAIVFLPGTIIHEISHFIMAKILFVRVGKMELLPVLNGQTLKLGSVQIGKTDIVRNFLIGIAPLVIGSTILLLILYFSFTKNIFGFNFVTVIVLYVLFVISNTMYSSKKDMEGAIEFILIVVLPVLILYFLGVRIPGLNLRLLNNIAFQNFIQMSSIFLVVPLILDFAIILFVKIIMRR